MNDLNTAGAIVMTQPSWLWLLPTLFFITLLLRAIGHRRQAASLASGDTSPTQQFFFPLISLLPHNRREPTSSPLRMVIDSAVIVCLVIALTQPVRIGERLPDPPQQRDIIFIVDTSITMTLRDYVLNGERIDRMTLLKGVLDRFVQQLPGERIGVIVFGDAAYTLVPLTRDQQLLRRMIARIQATMAGRFNNIGEAVALAVKQTQQQQEGQRHRVLVLLTDADRPTGSIAPETAATLAKQAKLPLYTIAIGATTTHAEEQRTTGLLYEPVNLALLKAISAHTGARNYQAADAQALEHAIHDIAQHETNKRKLPPRHNHQPLYFWPLALAAILLVFAAIGPAFRPRPLAQTHQTMDNIEP